VSRERNLRYKGRHYFVLEDNKSYELCFQLDFANMEIKLQLHRDKVEVYTEIVEMRMSEWISKKNKDISRKQVLEEERLALEAASESPEYKQQNVHSSNDSEPQKARGINWFTLGGLVFKLFKSAKVIKIALAGTAFAGRG